MSDLPERAIPERFSHGASIRSLSQAYNRPEERILDLLPAEARTRYQDVNQMFKNHNNINDVSQRTGLAVADAARYLCAQQLKEAIYNIRGFRGDLELIMEKCGCTREEAQEYEQLVIQEKGDPLYR